MGSDIGVVSTLLTVRSKLRKGEVLFLEIKVKKRQAIFG